ncbi:MAG: DUF1924 domain-containing protein [Oceanospirillales bacterium]|nr:DUF1924 domain-containing protein [Oceanospirillales bacterium]
MAALMVGSLQGMAQASEATDRLLKEYLQQGVSTFDASAGEAFWNREFEGGSCAGCHTQDPKQPGRHQRTRKPIEPMAPSVNSQRLTDVKQINKWFLRNCKGVLGRECSAQEKGDVLTWLQAQ